MTHDLLIKNGTVVDGTGSAGFSADVAIDGDKISAIGKNLGSGKKEIDAKGHVVAPGFIDSHTHMDAFVVQYPNGNPVVNYGVTSIVIGDCGASCAPVPPKPEPRQVLVQYLRRVLDKYVDDKDWRWNTFGDYLNYLEGKVAINVLPLMPHSPVRLTVMGEAAYQRAANPEELDAMHLRRARRNHRACQCRRRIQRLLSVQRLSDDSPAGVGRAGDADENQRPADRQ